MMPRAATDSDRLSLRIDRADKAKILRACDVLDTDMTGFIVKTALLAADKALREAEEITLSARDSALVMDLLDRPPAANAKLRGAARTLPPLR
jgi:uncharacterized protein (DUF1778 family)